MTSMAGWPGLAGAGAYAAQQAAKTAADGTVPPVLPCASCKGKDMSLAGRDREINTLKDEIDRLKTDLTDMESRIELMMPRSPETDARSDNELIKRLQEIDRLQHRNIEAAERRVCELVAYMRGKNIPIPTEGEVVAPVETQSWNGIL